MNEMRALTIQQPWASLVSWGVKTTENRTAWTSYEGEVAIHAGTRWSARGDADPRVQAAIRARRDAWPQALEANVTSHRGVILAAGRMKAHRVEPGCCDDPWADQEYGGKPVTCHIVLTDVKRLPWLIPCHGWLQVWALPAYLEERVRLSLAYMAEHPESVPR